MLIYYLISNKFRIILFILINKMMCKSKHFFRDTEYFIYEKENSIEIGKV